MENGREVKKSFCLLSVAYIVLGLVLVIWPDISVPVSYTHLDVYKRQVPRLYVK